MHLQSQIPILKNQKINQVSCGSKHSCLVDAEGDITCWGDNF